MYTTSPLLNPSTTSTLYKSETPTLTHDKWVKVGVSDLYNVEVVEGLSKGDVVYILPSKSLFDYQERFKERVSGSFSFG